MPRQNKQDYSSVGLKKSTIKQLKDYKIHPNQSMEEVIKQFLDEKNKLNKGGNSNEHTKNNELDKE